MILLLEDLELALDTIKNYRKTINKRKSKKQSVVATPSGRTYHELILEKIFDMIGVVSPNVNIETTFCFYCNKHFFHSPATAFPSKCPRCHSYYSKNKPGEFSRPDFLLHDRITNNVVIIYVNGRMHQKEHFQKKDYHQIKHLLKNNVKVIVIPNDMVEDSSNDVLAAFCKFTYDCINDDKLYTIYQYSAEEYQRILNN